LQSFPFSFFSLQTVCALVMRLGNGVAVAAEDAGLAVVVSAVAILIVWSL
jgi:hypothetical protein